MGIFSGTYFFSKKNTLKSYMYRVPHFTYIYICIKSVCVYVHSDKSHYMFFVVVVIYLKL